MRRLVVVVRPGPRTRTILGWLRRLVPAAILLVSPLSPPLGSEVVTVDSDDVEAGPLSLAVALARHRLEHLHSAAAGAAGAGGPPAPGRVDAAAGASGADPDAPGGKRVREL